MSYTAWFKQVVNTVQTPSNFQLYFRTSLFGLLIFASTYFYTDFTGIPSPLNKATADTSVLLMGFSMLLSSICYFWNFLDSKIIYRKHLGLIGFAFAVTHFLLSFSSFQRLFDIATWQTQSYWPALTGLLALIIFSVMAAISNQYSATHLGGKVWRGILRTGYIGLLFVWVHVVLLKSTRWLTWFQQGMKTPPSVSLLVSGFILVVVIMRLLLWWSLKRKAAKNTLA